MSKLLWFVWLALLQSTFGFAIPNEMACSPPHATKIICFCATAYDEESLAKNVYDVGVLAGSGYDSATVPIANDKENRTVGASNLFARFAKFLAAEGEVGAGQTLYRGVWDDHPAFQDALEGSANPRGGSATALEHNMGDTRSIYTSWTTDPALAAERAGPGGAVLQQSFPAFRLVTSPDLFGEGEVLVTGPVRGASVTPIPKP